MTETRVEGTRAHRVLVVLDTVSDNLGNLRSAVALAAGLQAELIGLFVEDTQLLEAVRSPASQEVMLWTARERKPDEIEMLRSLRALAALVQDDLAKAAEQARLSWSFRTVRGSGVGAVLEADINSDLLLLGALRRRIPRLSSQLPATGVGSISLIYTGTPAARRALSTALQLADRNRLGVQLLLLGQDPTAFEQLQALTVSRPYLKLLSVTSLEEESFLIGLLCRPQTGLLVIPADLPQLIRPEFIKRLQVQTNCPIVLAR